MNKKGEVIKNVFFIIILMFIIHPLFSVENITISQYPFDYFSVHNFDFRYINELIRKKDLSKQEDAYKALLENLSYDKEIVNFIKYVKEARNVILNNKVTRTFDSPEKIYNIFKSYFLNNKNIIESIPFVIAIGAMESEYGFITRNDLFKNFIKEESNIIISDIIKSVNDTYIFKVYGYKYGDETNKGKPLIFIIGKVKKTLVDNINNKYELIIFVGSYRDVTDDELKKTDLSIMSWDQQILYGILDHNYNFSTYEKYQTTVNNLRLRSKPSISNSEVIKSLKKDEIVKIQEIGNYEVINNLSGNWVKIKTDDNKSGWCFGAYLTSFVNPDEAPF